MPRQPPSAPRPGDRGCPWPTWRPGSTSPMRWPGAAAAAHDGGPLLLVTTNGIPAATASELARLTPGFHPCPWRPVGGVRRGGWPNCRATRLGSVTRLSGVDRYETAAAISAATFAPGVGATVLATGANFPDALAGGAAAAHYGGPILLTRQGTIPQATLNELARLGPGSIFVLGGSSVISNADLASLDPYTSGPVVRLAGTDRYGTSAAISEDHLEPLGHRVRGDRRELPRRSFGKCGGWRPRRPGPARPTELGPDRRRVGDPAPAPNAHRHRGRPGRGDRGDASPAPDHARSSLRASSALRVAKPKGHKPRDHPRAHRAVSLS